MTLPFQNAGQFSVADNCERKQALSQRNDADHPADLNSMYIWCAVTRNESVEEQVLLPKDIGI